MKKILAFSCFYLLILSVQAQNFSFGAITYDDYEFNKNSIDSNANAIVLREFGTASFQLDESTGRLMLVFDYHVKIKIYNKEGYKQANIVIPTYKMKHEKS